MSEMSKQTRKDMRAKAVRLSGGGIGNNDPQKAVDASSWRPPEALDAGRKTGARPIRPRIYKHGGKIQGDRAPRHPGKACRGGGFASGGGVKSDLRGTGPLSMMNTADANKETYGSFHEGGYKRGGMPGAGHDMAAIKSAVHKHERHDHKGEPLTKLKKGGKASGTYFGGTRPEGGRMPRAHGGRAKGKTNINIVIAQPKANGGQPGMMPPQGPVRPPMPPPQMQPPAGAPPMGGPPPSMAGPPGAGGPPMMRKAGGRTNADAIPLKRFGAASGEGRLEKVKIQERSHR